MLPVVVLAEARSDLFEAAAWFDKAAPGLGARFRQAVEQTVLRIAAHPEAHVVLSRGIRRARVGRFPQLFLYRVEQDAIVIFAVFHPSRDPRTWQERL